MPKNNTHQYSCELCDISIFKRNQPIYSTVIHKKKNNNNNNNNKFMIDGYLLNAI